MKVLMLITIGAILSLGSYAQTEPSKKLPPIKMLPKKPGQVKKIHELPQKSKYEIFNNFGEFIVKGEAEFIDITHYKAGVYFIKYEDKTERIEIK